MAKCLVCKVEKQETEFRTRVWRASGIVQRHTNATCNLCLGKPTKKKHVYKPMRVCIWCGEKKGVMKYPRKYDSMVCSKCISQTLEDMPRNPKKPVAGPAMSRRFYMVKSKYGLTRDGYESLLARANGRCEICGSTYRLVIDHCHANGTVRGFLCNSCNWALGCYEKGWRPGAVVATFDAWIENAGPTA